jgi:choline dehydrogenase
VRIYISRSSNFQFKVLSLQEKTRWRFQKMAKICSLLALLSALNNASPTCARTLLGTNFGNPANATYDYVVVGGGTAGLAIAARLAEDERNSVAVIEAGSFYELSTGNISQIPAFAAFWAGKDLNDTNPTVDWGLKTVPQPVSIPPGS